MKVIYSRKEAVTSTFHDLTIGSTYVNGAGKLRMKVRSIKSGGEYMNTIDPETGLHSWTDVDETIRPVNATITVEPY